MILVGLGLVMGNAWGSKDREGNRGVTDLPVGINGEASGNAGKAL